MKNIVLIILVVILVARCEKKAPATGTATNSTNAKSIHDSRQYPWQITTYGNFKEAYRRYNKQGC